MFLPGAELRAPSAEAEPQPERVYLNLENITAARDGAILRVYVGGPGGVDEQVAGSVALFGAAPQSTNRRWRRERRADRRPRHHRSSYRI